VSADHARAAVSDTQIVVAPRPSSRGVAMARDRRRGRGQSAIGLRRRALAAPRPEAQARTASAAPVIAAHRPSKPAPAATTNAGRPGTGPDAGPPGREREARQHGDAGSGGPAIHLLESRHSAALALLRRRGGGGYVVHS